MIMIGPLILLDRGVTTLLMMAMVVAACTGHMWVDSVLGILCVVVLMLYPFGKAEEKKKAWTDFFVLRDIEAGKQQPTERNTLVDDLYKRGYLLRIQHTKGVSLRLSREGKRFLAELKSQLDA